MLGGFKLFLRRSRLCETPGYGGRKDGCDAAMTRKLTCIPIEGNETYETGGQ
jgi:hypothetical protein